MPSPTNDALQYAFQGIVSVAPELTSDGLQYLFQGVVAAAPTLPNGDGIQYLFQGDVSDSGPLPGTGVGTVLYPISEDPNTRPPLRY